MIRTEPQTAPSLARVTGVLGLFERLAADVVQEVRAAMSVPSEADPDVEAEFRVFRTHLEQFLPEFEDIYAGLLIRHLGAEHVAEILAALETPFAQRYLETAVGIDSAMAPLLAALAERMLILAGDPGTA